MDIVQSIINRIEERLTETKNPCKLYASAAKAAQAGEKQAQIFGNRFDREAKPARFVVVHIASINKWTPAFDYTELFARRTATGGYVGSDGFYTY